MKIYFSASISGGRKYLDTYKDIVKYLKSKHHTILTEHIIYDNVLELEEELSAQEIYERDIQFLKKCDVIIAEVSNPSLGVGYEICYAEILKKPILCLFHDNIFVSRMIIGNTSPFITLSRYTNTEMIFKSIDDFFTNLKF